MKWYEKLGMKWNNDVEYAAPSPEYVLRHDTEAGLVREGTVNNNYYGPN